MSSVCIFKRKRKGKPEKIYTAQIRFGESHGGATYWRSTGVTDRREAEAIARRIAREIEENELPRRGVEILTVADMFSRWIDERGHELRSGKDIKWQIEMILRLVGGTKEVRELGNKDINAFVQDAKLEKAGPVVINRCLGRLRATLNYAAEMWEEPVKVISWKKLMQDEPNDREIYLSPEEARRLMEILPLHIGLAMAFSLYTGMRLDELTTLTWDRVDWERGAAAVFTKGRGKELIRRTVWLSGKAVAILIRIREMLAKTDSGSVFDLTNRRKHWEKARVAIGRSDVTWHDLRGMTATWSRQYAGKDIRLISQALGHSDTKVTERYARVVDREIVEMLDQLPDITTQGPEQNRLANQLAKPESRSDAIVKTL